MAPHQINTNKHDKGRDLPSLKQTRLPQLLLLGNLTVHSTKHTDVDILKQDSATSPSLFIFISVLSSGNTPLIHMTYPYSYLVFYFFKKLQYDRSLVESTTDNRGGTRVHISGFRRTAGATHTRQHREASIYQNTYHIIYEMYRI